VTNVTFILKLLQIQNKEKRWGDMVRHIPTV